MIIIREQVHAAHAFGFDDRSCHRRLLTCCTPSTHAGARLALRNDFSNFVHLYRAGHLYAKERPAKAVYPASWTPRIGPALRSIAKAVRRCCNLLQLASKAPHTLLGIVAASVFWLSLADAASALSLDLPSTDVSKEQYERAIKSHSSRSNLPSRGEAEMLLQLDKDLFTDDAWEGMKT